MALVTICYSFGERSASRLAGVREFFKQFPEVQEGSRSSDGLSRAKR